MEAAQETSGEDSSAPSRNRTPEINGLTERFGQLALNLGLNVDKNHRKLSKLKNKRINSRE